MRFCFSRSFGDNDRGNPAIFTPPPCGKNSQVGHRKEEMLDVVKVREVGRKGGFCSPLSSEGVTDINSPRKIGEE